MKLLVTSDLHLGVRSSGVESPLVPTALAATTETWRRIVDLAVSEEVVCVLLAGDVVHRENRFFEAYSVLEDGVRKLDQAGIHVVAVSGNHDHDVFPRLAAALGEGSRFRLLGTGGQWERLEIASSLALHGWSFPQLHVPRSPMGDYPFRDEEMPAIGLLHGDLDQKESRYGPVSRSDLARAPVMLWCLGHVHRQAVVDTAGPKVLIPGSPHPLDPSERGSHGPWLVEIEGASLKSMEQVPLAPIRYQVVEVDLEGETSLEDVPGRLAQAVRLALEAALNESDGRLRCLSCRLVISGRTPLHGGLGPAFQNLAELSPTLEDAVAVVDGYPELRTRPPVDLQEVSRGNDPAGALARLLAPDSKGLPDDLVKDAVQAVTGVHRSGEYGGVSSDLPPDREEVEALLRRTAEDLLHELLEGADEVPG